MGNKFAPMLGAFLDECRESGIKVIYTTHEFRADKKDMTGPVARVMAGREHVLEAGGVGVEIYPPVAPKEGEIVIHKHFYNAFFNTELDIILRSWGIDTLVITGVCTDVCCFATAREAQFRDYDVVFISDLNGTGAREDIGYGAFTAEEHNAMALNNIFDVTGDVLSGEEFLSILEGSKQNA
jgi:ureidoacrylate peracid hydrolase